MVCVGEKAVTIVLVSDGIGTCGGPFQADREAKKAGVDFVMHTVGFNVGEVDGSQLECAAQASERLYFRKAFNHPTPSTITS